MREQSLQIPIELGRGGPATLLARLYLPEDDNWQVLLVCLPGGGASREYFDLGEHDGTDFSFVSRMAAQGFASLAIDHPGTGENALADDFAFFTPRAAADVLGQSVPAFCEAANITPQRLIGVGHSMGGMVITLVKAHCGLFERIALLGSSARGLEWGLTEEEKTFIERPDALEDNLERLVLERFGALFPPGLGGPSGKSIYFGGSSEELTARLRAVSTNLFGAGATTSMTRGAFAKEAAAIDVPILFAFGDHDIGAPPEEVPQDYPNAASVETILLPETGHNHFAFPSIAQLTGAMVNWIG